MGSSIADIITTKDLSVEDTSELKTGNTRRSYNMAIHQGKCPEGQHEVGGKCVPKPPGTVKPGTSPAGMAPGKRKPASRGVKKPRMSGY